MTRVTILWCQWAGYMDVCARALVEQFGCDLTIAYFPPESNAPFSDNEFFQYRCNAIPIDNLSIDLPDEIIGKPADILLVCGWHVPAYKRYSARSKGRSVRVLCMDNQWLATSRQWMGVLASPFFLRPCYDMAFVPGRRQAAFARRLGFQKKRIFEGHYSCDFERFSERYQQRKSRPLSRSFMFVGRLVSVKGIATLFDAWQTFVAHGHTGWTLKVVGGGSYAHPGGLPPGVEMHGFIQPSDLPDKFLEGDVFVLPSNYEPWGLVIHESAATGMPIICSDACGAGDKFVKSGVNGSVIPKNDVGELVTALESIAASDEPRVRSMGAASASLAGLRTPATWASTVMTMGGYLNKVENPFGDA